MAQILRRARGVVLILAMALVAAAVSVIAQRGPTANGTLPSVIFTAPPQTPIPEGIGRITGRVFDRDLNTPIPNATVVLSYLAPAQNASPLRQAVAGREVDTDERGEFAATNLAFGDYSIAALADGYTRARRFGSTIENGERVSLSAGRPDGAASFRLSRVASVSGVVRGADGQPVAMAPVRIYHHVFSGTALVWQPMPVNAFTDEAGRYRFRNAPPGDYIVGVHFRTQSIPASVSDLFWRAPGAPETLALRARLTESNAVQPPPPTLSSTAGVFAADGYRWGQLDAMQFVKLPSGAVPGAVMNRTTFADGAATIPEAAVISLAPGDARTDVDIRVRQVAGVKVSGTLIGRPEQIAHVGLRLLPFSEADVLQTFPGEVSATVTDAEGRFAFLAVPPGAVAIDSWIMSSLGAPVDGRPQPMTRTLTGAVRYSLDVLSQDILDLKVPVLPPLTVRGRMMFEAGDSRLPEASLSVLTLTPVSTRSAVQRPKAVGTDFMFDGLAPGRYILNAAGTGSWTVRSMTVGGKETLHRAFELTDADVTTVVVTMAPGLSRLTGFVRDTAGLGLEGAQVVLFPADYRGWIEGGAASAASRSVIAGPTGSFTMTGISDGDYRIIAFASSIDNDWKPLSSLSILAPLAQEVRVTNGQVVNVEVRKVLPDIPRR